MLAPLAPLSPQRCNMRVELGIHLSLNANSPFPFCSFQVFKQHIARKMPDAAENIILSNTCHIESRLKYSS